MNLVSEVPCSSNSATTELISLPTAADLLFRKAGFNLRPSRRSGEQDSNERRGPRTCFTSRASCCLRIHKFNGHIRTITNGVDYGRLLAFFSNKVESFGLAYYAPSDSVTESLYHRLAHAHIPTSRKQLFERVDHMNPARVIPLIPHGVLFRQRLRQRNRERMRKQGNTWLHNERGNENV
jgi:hypothetical protein